MIGYFSNLNGSYVSSSWFSPFIGSRDVLYSLHFKIIVMFGHKLLYEIKVTFSEISFKLRQTNWNVAINKVNVVVDKLPSQITVYIFFNNWYLDLAASMHINTVRCHPPKMVSFQWNWCQKFSTLLWTPLARRKALSESYATHTISC